MNKRNRNFPDNVKRTVCYFGDVSDEGIHGLIKDIVHCSLDSRNRRRKAEVLLLSDGGNPEASFAFYDIVRSRLSAIRLSMIVTGEASSAGVILLLSAKRSKRFITENSRIMLHEIYWTDPKGNDINMSHKGFAKIPKDIQQTIKTSQKVYISIISERTGLSQEKVLKMMKDKAVLMPDDAVRYGFAKKVVSITGQN